MARLIDRVKAMMAGDRPSAPVAELIGFRPTAIEEGTVVVEFTAAERHWNPMGTLHGGVLCDDADAAMGLAFATTLGMKRASRPWSWR